MDVTVLTGHVSIDNFVTEHVGRPFFVVVGLTRDHFKVAVLTAGSDTITGHLLHSEVHHHWARSIHYKVDALVVELLPIDIVLRQVCCAIEVRDRVYHIGTSGVFHGNTRCDARSIIRHIRQHLNKDGIVEHRRVKQLLLHCLRKVFVLPDTPTVVLIETIKRLIICREHGFRTGLLQRLSVSQVVDEPQIVVESTCQYVLVRILQLIIHTTSQPTRVVTFVVQVVTVMARKESTTGNRQA